MKKLKIVYVTHQMAHNFSGGAETQIIKTKEYLDKLGLKIKLFNIWEDTIDDFDVVHIFNPRLMPVESSKIADECKKNNVKLVVSPIYWISPNQNSSGLKSFFNKIYISSLKNPLLNKSVSLIGVYKYLKNLFEISDIILPNTNAELNLLKDFYRISHDRFSVIPNGVDLDFKTGNPRIFKENLGVDDFILFSGGIYKRKNVLSLIKAFNKSDLSTNLIIMGKTYEDNYFEWCKKESNDNVKFLPSLPHDSEMLKSAYKCAKVVVLPSYFETPGLSCLEGGLAGINVVVTEIGGTKEYFGDYAWYLDPEDELSIEKAIISAYNAPKTDKLSKHIEKNFTWEKVAEKMLNVYLKL